MSCEQQATRSQHESFIPVLLGAPPVCRPARRPPAWLHIHHALSFLQTEFLQQTENSRSLCPDPHVHQHPSARHPPAPTQGWLLTVASAARAASRTVLLKMWSQLSITNVTWGLVSNANFQVESQTYSSEIPAKRPASPGGSKAHFSLRTNPSQARQTSREEEGGAPTVSLQPRSWSLPRACPTPSPSDAISSTNYNSKSSSGPGVIFTAEGCPYEME